MQVKFRIRVNRQIKTDTIYYELTPDEVVSTIKRTRPPNTYNDLGKYCDNFSAKITVLKNNNLILKQLDELLYKLKLDHSIGIIEYEFNTHLKGVDHQLENNPLINYYIQLTAKELLKNYSTSIDVIMTKDYYNNSNTVEFSPDKIAEFICRPKKLLEPISLEHNNPSKYQLYINNKIVVERTFPNDLTENQLLEEVFFLEIEPGSHTLRIDNIGEFFLGINAMAVDQTVYQNINARHFNFKIS